ncbi:hypothetical protein [Thiocystis violacea]|uniref:hypothetical protein n=1 Tax=Thiocystis violacea TaxID=13725 RepID=UPI00190804B5|nr:hypothetical protein [Thiocystis violacea]
MQHIILTFCFVVLFSCNLVAEDFGGIDFPGGGSSFADELISYEPLYNGGPGPSDPNWSDPIYALGIPYHGEGEPYAVTLGHGGRLTVRFLNNSLTGSDDSTPDLHIFEVGPDVEDTFVEISKDGITYYDVGKVYGSTDSIDIDSYGFTSADEFYFVRLTDDPNEGNGGGSTPGADIDAIGAIATVSYEIEKPEIKIQGGYFNADTTSGSFPPANDCAGQQHYGRMIVDEVNSILYICTLNGWDAH